MTRKLLLTTTLACLAACAADPTDGPLGGAEPRADLARTASALVSGSIAPIFGSNMVLQRGTPVPVFGTAEPGTAVVVEFQGQSVAAVADAAGQWMAHLAAMPASSSPSPMTVTLGTTSLTLADVEVGEVWLCSGQSNMGKPLSFADDSAPYIADAPNHDLHLFRMTAGDSPATTTWQLSDATTAADFSAVCYWMGLDLTETLGVPVGLIQATVDGSAISEWQHTSGGTGEAYDAMVAPLQPFAIRGVLWYQGESNGGDVEYGLKLTSLIGEWRADWGLATLPFGIIQLPATKWVAARLAQLEVSQTVPNTYLVVTSDLPGSKLLHPTAKYPVGIRSSIGARGAVYGEPIEYSGPIPAPTSYVSGRTVVVQYSHLGDGLMTADGLPPGPFQIAPVSGKYVTATATLVGDTIEVTSSRVSTPKFVRYAFSAAGNLRNAVTIPTEGGTRTVTELPATLAQIDLL